MDIICGKKFKIDLECPPSPPPLYQERWRSGIISVLLRFITTKKRTVSTLRTILLQTNIDKGGVLSIYVFDFLPHYYFHDCTILFTRIKYKIQSELNNYDDGY